MQASNWDKIIDKLNGDLAEVKKKEELWNNELARQLGKQGAKITISETDFDRRKSSQKFKKRVSFIDPRSSSPDRHSTDRVKNKDIIDVIN